MKPILNLNQNEIKIEKSQLDDITVKALIDLAGIHVLDADQGDTDITYRVRLDKTKLNRNLVNQPQLLPINVLTDDNQLQQVGELDVTLLDAQQAVTTAKQKQPMSKGKKIALGVVGVVALLLLFGACHQHGVNQQNKAENASQSSQISHNSDDISKLAYQVSALRKAVKQYHDDHDQAAYNQALQNIQNEINQMMNNQQNSSFMQNKLDELNNLINQLKSTTPNNASSILRNAHLGW